jgi:virulence-associated protein VagC
MKLKVTDAGIVIPREMLPNVREVDVRKEGGGMVLTPLPDPDDPIWELGNDPVVCGLSDASENHDRYLYETDS